MVPATELSVPGGGRALDAAIQVHSDASGRGLRRSACQRGDGLVSSSSMSKERKRRPKGECTIPPAFPPDAIGEFVLKRSHGEERAIREYVEWQARGEKVTHAEKIMTERLRDRRLDAWDVRTNKERYWVITNPRNLYSQELFPSLDY
ncbi:MAG: hypothetical protein DMG07_19525, partial [Acidobacteria bacterium]